MHLSLIAALVVYNYYGVHSLPLSIDSDSQLFIRELQLEARAPSPIAPSVLNTVKAVGRLAKPKPVTAIATTKSSTTAPRPVPKKANTLPLDWNSAPVTTKNLKSSDYRAKVEPKTGGFVPTKNGKAVEFDPGAEKGRGNKKIHADHVVEANQVQEAMKKHNIGENHPLFAPSKAALNDPNNLSPLRGDLNGVKKDIAMGNKITNADRKAKIPAVEDYMLKNSHKTVTTLNALDLAGRLTGVPDFGDTMREKMNKFYPSTFSNSKDKDKKVRSLDDMVFWARDADEETNLLVRSFGNFKLDELD